MGDTVIITEDEPKPSQPDVVVNVPAPEQKPASVVIEKTTVTETRVE
jgi:hypothetical protein